MPIHTLHRRQIMPVSLDAAWDFFSDPRNLERITPPELSFQVLTPDLPSRIHSGLMIMYRVCPLFGIPMTWLTEITHVEDGKYFVDEQRVGPYRIWHHEHWFRATDDGQVEMEDRITYQLPFGWLSEPVHLLIVKQQLDRIFDFRTSAVEQLFPRTTR